MPLEAPHSSPARATKQADQAGRYCRLVLHASHGTHLVILEAPPLDQAQRLPALLLIAHGHHSLHLQHRGARLFML